MIAAEKGVIVCIILMAATVGIPMIFVAIDYFKQKRNSRRTIFMQILYEIEKLHKQKHEVNFILINDDLRGIDFDRVMGIPVERAVLPKGVRFVVAERKGQGE